MTFECIATILCESEITDMTFDPTGQFMVVASMDGVANMYNTETQVNMAKLDGHEKEITKVMFNPQGNKLLTSSADMTVRLWNVENTECVQVAKMAHVLSGSRYHSSMKGQL
uniref:Dynein assembly factor with WDR repeat domains 1-like isoform X2 n=1 Tax=Saccoglossus kowalevskii TaxID=10224 RepID=A0ABM0MLE1_SACKO|nr:PREDICTED: dynein assembly factor with WDR repeat domains 1-like isoform X2 [Saccoglossus kowalevskii]